MNGFDERDYPYYYGTHERVAVGDKVNAAGKGDYTITVVGADDIGGVFIRTSTPDGHLSGKIRPGDVAFELLRKARS